MAIEHLDSGGRRLASGRPSSPEPLGIAAARGVLWSGGGQIVRQLIQLVTSLALVRLLAPDDFGLLAMAMFFIGIGQLLGDFGIGTAVVQSRTSDPVVLSTCFWLNVAIAAIVAAAVVGGAPLIAAFYERADLAPIVSALAASMVLNALQSVPAALLARDLRFREIVRAQLFGSAAGACGAIAMAASGYGVWSMVAQPLVGATVASLSMLVASRWVPQLRFSWQGVAPMARFSAALLATSLVNYATRNVDSLLVGRVLGAAALGLYAMAIQLMLYPLQHVSSVFVRVLFPTLSQLKDDLARLRAVYLKTVGAIALVTFPVMGGLFALAGDFVQVVFGPRWVEMTPVLGVLAWVGMLQSIGTTTGTLYLSMGRSDVALKVTIVSAPVLITGIAAGLPWGILGVAIGYASASLSLFYFTAMTAFRLVGLELKHFHRVLGPPMLAMFLMVTSVLAAVAALGDAQPAVRLAVGVATGVVTYAAATVAVNREQLRATLAVLRSLRTPR